jgi:phage-related minor tail protein
MASNKSIGLLNIVFGADLKGFNRAMKKAQRSVRKFGKSMQRTGANMTRSITLPVIALGAAAIKTFAEFEQSMLKVKAVSGATGKEFESLKNKALELGSSTMFTASEVAGLQLELAKLGFSTQQINDSTESILQLSQATGHDLAQSGEIVASTLNSFNMAASESTKVADMFAKASSSAAIDMEKLSVAMPTVGATASAVGIPLEELSAQMMVLADRGMEASTMGTHLRKIFVELATKGISYEDAMDKIRNSTDQVTTATNLFGKRAFAAGLILANNTSQTKVYEQQLKNSAGTTKEMADIMDSGISGAMRRLKSQAEGVAIELGGSLIPLFEKLLTGISNLMRWWSGLNDTTKNTATAFALVVAGIGPMLSVLGSLAVAFSALGSPIGLAVAAIVGIVVAFAYVRENWEAFKERLGDWSWWQNAIIQLLQWFVEYNPMSLLLDGFNEVLDFFGRETIPSPFEKIVEDLEGLKIQTKEYENEFSSFKDAMINQGKDIIDMFGDMNLASKVGVGGGGVGGDTEETGGFIGPLQEGEGASFTPFKSYLDMLEAMAQQTESKTVTLATIWADFADNVKRSWQTVGEQLGASLAQGSESFKEFATNAKNQIRSVIKGLIAEGVSAAIANALKSSAITPWMIPVVAGAAAGLANSAFSSLIPEFAQGGLVSGATLGLIGEGSGTSISNPEVIAPLDKLKNMIGGDMRVTGRLVGNDIFLSNEKTGVSRNRYI